MFTNIKCLKTFRNVKFLGTIYDFGLILFVMKIHLINEHIFYKYSVRLSVGMATIDINVRILELYNYIIVERFCDFILRRRHFKRENPAENYESCKQK